MPSPASVAAIERRPDPTSRPGALLSPQELKSLVRTVPDFPAPGILFRDITTLIAHGSGLSSTIEHLAAMAEDARAEAVAGIEARGFMFGVALAVRMGLGFVPLRKAGKLPVETIATQYELEYGTASLEMDPSAVDPGERVILVDDLIATGGTSLAGIRLLRRASAIVDHALFVIDLPDLGGASALALEGVNSHFLIDFPGH